jgi:nitrogen fixation/metabolism regulation signal transduction histidine kinase
MFRSYRFQIGIKAVLVAAWAFALAWSVFTGQSIIWSVILAFGLILQGANLIQYQNKVTERINYFFESVKNEDFSLTFEPRDKSAIIRSLHQNMQLINEYIQQVKIEAQQQEHYFRALIEQVGTGILTFNEKGFVLHANQSLKKLLGLQQLTHLKQLEKVDPKLALILRQIQPNEQKLVQFEGKQGATTLLIKSGAFRNQKEKLNLLSIQDINRELDEKELDSWIKLIRVLTHEIMNSIAPVTSLSESLSCYYQKDGAPITSAEVSDKLIQNTIRGLEIIKEQGKGLISFVESYRKFTRLPKPEKKLVSVSDLLEKTALLRRAALPGHHTRITVKHPPKELLVPADEKLISQVLINLVKNAAEALDKQERGEIELIGRENQAGQVEILVRDNGPGIPPELMDEIFVPFFTTRENGSGIGLSLSRQIMRLHGGSLKASSVPGKETIFVLCFS